MTKKSIGIEGKETMNRIVFAMLALDFMLLILIQDFYKYTYTFTSYFLII